MPVTDIIEKLRIWKLNLEEVFRGDQQEDNTSSVSDIKRYPITKKEIIQAAKHLKNRMAYGEDGIPAEIINLFNKEHISDIQDILDTIYDTGDIPLDWLT